MNLVKNKNIYHPELSYEITGLLFKVHNNSGRFKTERQYYDMFERLLKENKFIYSRETELKKLFDNAIENGNIPDFIIENKIIIDFKAKKFITKDDYYQMLRYLEVANLPLGFIVNFRSTYLKPKRVINSKYYSSNSSVHS
jgi:GxxExxY protein